MRSGGSGESERRHMREAQRGSHERDTYLRCVGSCRCSHRLSETQEQPETGVLPAWRGEQIVQTVALVAWNCDATRQCRSRAQHNERVPFDTEGILQHLNATHQVYFHTLEGAAFTLEESDACLQGDPIQ